MADLGEDEEPIDVPKPSKQHFTFGQVDFSLVTSTTLRRYVQDWIADPTRTVVITLTGAHGVYESRRDVAVSDAHASADLVLCDGTPPYIAAVIAGLRHSVDRIPGRVATAIIARTAAEEGTHQFFLGGPEGLAEKTKSGLEKSIGQEIQGDVWSPPFSTEVTPEFVDAILDRVAHIRKPAILWIGLSTPKQEILAARIKARFGNGLCIVCVGAAFDMYAGTKSSAPAHVSNLGLEWLYRSMQEPRRLPARYLRALPTVVSGLTTALTQRLTGRYPVPAETRGT